MNGTMEYYDKAAQEWAQRGYAPDARMESLYAFLDTLPKGARVLDLCCGAGYETGRIAAYGYEALGIDFSKESIRIARQKNPGIPFYQEDMLCDYSHIGRVDAIVVIAGLVHIENGQLPLAFARMKQVLEEKGKLFLTVREGEGRMEERSLCTVDGEVYDRNFIAHTLAELVEAAGEDFRFQCEMPSDMMVWKNYVFERR